MFIVDRHTWGGGIGIVGGLSSETVVVLVVMAVVVVVLGVTLSRTKHVWYSEHGMYC